MYLREFIEDCSARGLTPETIYTYQSNIGRFLEFIDKDPTKAEMSDFRAFLAHLRTVEYTVGRQKRKGVASATLGVYFSSINSFYDFLVWEKYTQVNLVPQFRKRYIRLKLQRNGENTRPLISIEQMIELLELCLRQGDILAWAFIFFAAKTGLRKGELLAMKVQDLNFEGTFGIPFNQYESYEHNVYMKACAIFNVAPKAKRTNRQGFMDDELVYVMHQYLEWREPRALNTDALWITPNGYPLDKNDPYELVTKYASMLGIHDPEGPLNKKFTPHCLRHFFTTWMRRRGMLREFIKELRGDVRGEAIDFYDHIDLEELRISYLEHVFKLLKIDTKQSTLIPFSEEIICS